METVSLMKPMLKAINRIYVMMLQSSSSSSKNPSFSKMKKHPNQDDPIQPQLKCGKLFT